MAKVKATTATPSVLNFAKNRKARLEKHLKKHPNDDQALLALRENKQVSTRKASVEKLGWLKKSPGVATHLRVVTKEAAGIVARLFAFTRKQPYHTQLVAIGEGYVWKHTNKTSNFLSTQK